MHVDAKRYFCAVNKDYWDSLSFASKTSLELQGGIFSETEAVEFINQPYAEDAVELGIWDDLAKIQNLKTADLEYFISLMNQLVIG